MKQYFLFPAVFFSCILQVFSQTITITGKVSDSHTEEPLPYSSVYIKGSTIGTTTDDNGSFTLDLSIKADTLVFSTVGYTTVKKVIPTGSQLIMNAALDRTNYSLAVAMIYAGEDPAITIFKKVQKNKSQNNKDKLNSYQYEVYNKLEVDVDQINTKIKNNALLKPFGFVYHYMDSTSEDRPFLPMYLAESISDYYARKSPKAKKEVIKGSRLAGGNNESISQFLGAMYQDVNVYDNRMSLLGVEFISPIAAGGLFYYKYVLMDSMYLDGRKCYKVSFHPKREGQNTFIGDLWINDTTWAIKRLSMTMAKGANINYISRMSLYQDYVPVTDSVWLCKKDRFIVDFISPKKNSAGLIGRKTTSYKNIIANNPFIDSVFKDKLDIITLAGAINQKDDFWNHERHDSLSHNEKNIYKLVDTIQSLPIFKTYSKVLSTLSTGYLPNGKIEFGPWYYLFSKNRIEGYRVGFGLKTGHLFSKKILLSAFGAYGFKDVTYKFDFKGVFVPIKKPRLEFKARYLKDIITYNQLPEELGENNIFGFLMRRVDYPAKLTGNEEFQFSILKEWLLGWSEKISLVQSQLHPYFDLKSQNNFSGSFATYNNAELILTSRFAYREKFVSGEFLRASIGSDYPIVSLQMHKGVKGWFASKYDYQKVRLQIDDHFNTGIIGSFYYSIIAEKIWNKDPMPIFLLGVMPGNDTYYFDKYAFNNMNRYEFVADEYVSMRLTEYLGGFPFNYVPAMKKLKWRTFLGSKMTWGNMNEKNKAFNGYVNGQTVNPFEVAAKVPYIELGTGIENIFKFLRIDFVWRLNYLEKSKYLYAAPLGIKASLQVEF